MAARADEIPNAPFNRHTNPGHWAAYMVDKIRYCLDLQALQGESRHRGIGRYTRGLVEAIIRSERVEPTVLLNTALSEGFYEARDWARDIASDFNCKVFTGPDRIMGLLPDIEARERCAAILYEGFVSSLGVDWLHNSAPFDGMGDDTTIGLAADQSGADYFKAATLYDLIPFQESEIHLLDPRYRSRYFSRLKTLCSFDLLFAISDYTRSVAIEQFGLLPEKVVAISTDTSSDFQQLNLSARTRSTVLKKYGITRPFIIHTGILEARKNVRRLIDAFSSLPISIRCRFQLVFAGKATDAQIEDLTTFSISVGLARDDLVFAGFVTDKDLAVLYNLTEVLVMPSFSEGFGLPLLEAMRCGAPVLGADATAIPEVVGSRLYLFDPHNSASLAKSLHLMLTDEGARFAAREHSRQQQARFSWRASSDRALDAVYEMRHRRGRGLAIPALPLAATHDDFAKIKKLLPPDHSATLDPKAGWPAIAIRDNEITPEQEDVLLRGPFALLANESQSVIGSATLKYFVDGYAQLYRERDASQFHIDTSKLAALGSAVFAAWADETSSANVRVEVNCFDRMVGVLDKISKGLSSDEATEMSQYILANFANDKPRPVLFLDITELAKKDAGTGIQRVVRNVLFHLITIDLPIRVEPIFRDGDRYRYARSFCARLLGLAPFRLADDYVYFSRRDIFLGLDLDALITDAAMDRFRVERMRGVKLAWIIYDILPVKRPEWFDEGLAQAVQKWFERIGKYADQLVCISQAVAEEVRESIEAGKGRREYELAISWWHLGSELDFQPTAEMPVASEITYLPTSMPIFLTVGTIEPRKGIAKLLDNAEILWAEGYDVCFVLVGRRGWNIETTLRRILNHPELGRRLIWLEKLSDELLDQLYARVTAVLLPSEGEGFGLPLVEAAQHGTPIIARDIPIFREIGRDGAYYFNNDAKRGIADGVVEWLAMQAEGRHPVPLNVEVRNWRESSLNLLGAVVGGEGYETHQLASGGKVDKDPVRSAKAEVGGNP